MSHASRSGIRVAASAAVLVALAANAPAASPPGAPDLRAARATDTRSQPRAYQEWWDIRALDPHSDAAVVLTFLRNPNGSGLVVRGRAPGAGPTAEADVGGAVLATPKLISVMGGQQSPGGGRVRFTAGGAVIRLSGQGLSGRLTLGRIDRGPAALGFGLGPGLFNPQVVPRAGLSWSMPIASSTARGSVDISGVHVALDGWIVSYEHTWGDLIEEDNAWGLWDDWVVHRRGQTWIAYGLNRSDTVTGPGAREAMWLGLLARVGHRRMALCRPRIDRRRWVIGLGLQRGFAGRLRARCPHLHADFSDVAAERGFGDLPGFVGGAVGPARLSGRGVGWVVHRVPG
jgi:hypothetical protein